MRPEAGSRRKEWCPNLPVWLVYVGLLLMVAGFLSIIKPLRFLRIRSRRAGAAIFLSGLALAILGAAWPVRLHRAAAGGMRLDEFMPAYHFHEVHSIRVHAAPGRVYRAIRTVTPKEIRFFSTLMEVRELPARLLGGARLRPLVPNYLVRSHNERDSDAHEFSLEVVDQRRRRVEGRKVSVRYELEKGKTPAGESEIVRVYEEAIRKRGGVVISREDCCRSTLKLDRDGVWIEIAADADGRGYGLTIVQEGGPAATRPIVDLFTRSGFLLLSEEPDRELVLGTIGRYWGLAGGVPPRLISDAQAFAAFADPGYVKVTCNFFVEDEGVGWSRVVTETRVLGTDSSASRKFALYWRVIYPGSATIRRMWLKAIKRRAERSDR